MILGTVLRVGQPAQRQSCDCVDEGECRGDQSQLQVTERKLVLDRLGNDRGDRPVEEVEHVREKQGDECAAEKFVTCSDRGAVDGRQRRSVSLN